MNYDVNNNEIIIASSDDIETARYIRDTIRAHNGIIEREVWKSKYNSYVVYNHEPFATNGFKLIIILKSGLVYNDFILFHLSQQLKNVEHLEKCLTI